MPQMQSQETKVNVQSAWSQFSQLEELFHFMLLAAYIDARPLFYATEIFCSLQLLTWSIVVVGHQHAY